MCLRFPNPNRSLSPSFGILLRCFAMCASELLQIVDLHENEKNHKDISNTSYPSFLPVPLSPE